MKYIFAVVLAMYIGLRLLSVGFDMSNSDALRWHIRARNFYEAIKSNNYEATYQKYHPGVTIMWLVGGAQHLMRPLTYGNADHYSFIDSAARTSIVLVLTVLFCYLVYLASILYSPKVAMLFAFFIAVEPYLIGIDRWLHLTSLENYMAFGSVLSLLAWQRQRKIQYLYISSMLFSLGLLTKITAVISLPIILFILIESKDFKAFLKFLGLSLLVAFVSFPALWVTPVLVATNIYTAVTSAVEGDLRVQDIPGWVNTLYYALVLLLKTSPLLLVLFGISIKKADKYILGYFIVYFLALTFSGEKIERYVIALFLPMILIVANCISNLSRLKILIGIQLIYLVFVSYIYFPNYSAYYTGFYYGYKVANTLGIYANSGEYFREAAIYLNTLGRDTTVYVPANIDTFSVYFKGKLSEEAQYTVQQYTSRAPSKSNTFGPRGYNVIGIYE